MSSSSSVNPYRPPSATVADVREPGAATQFGVPAAKVAASRGANWIGEGWTLFKVAPWMWIVALLIGLGIQICAWPYPVSWRHRQYVDRSDLHGGDIDLRDGIAQGAEGRCRQLCRLQGEAGDADSSRGTLYRDDRGW